MHLVFKPNRSSSSPHFLTIVFKLRVFYWKTHGLETCFLASCKFHTLMRD